ncbi:MAG TPA: hypothetical protein VGX71_05925 [Pseudaminobacter sp.]|nr:hypothetical protein [Pseudaminobacter sp.]
MKSSDDYSPRFPRSISGNEYRPPLDHPDIEAVGRRADRLYRTAPLTDDERPLLLKKYDGLKAADLFLTGRLDERPLPETDLRPVRPWSGDGLAGSVTEYHVGFVARTREYVERLERRYTRSATVDDDLTDDRPIATDPSASERPVLANDDQPGDPGDDI